MFKLAHERHQIIVIMVYTEPMKYSLLVLALSAGSTLYADTYQGKNGKAAHNQRGTAVQTSNGTAVHRSGSSTVRSTNGAYHAGGAHGVYHTNGGAVRRSNTTVVRTNTNWNDAYWHSNRYGYWNGHRGYWRLVRGNHVFVVVD
jgi:hypothetical protein